MVFGLTNVLVLLTLSVVANGNQKNVEQRVTDLLAKMTLAEKFGQLEQLSGYGREPHRPELIELAKKGLLGSMLNVLGAERVNELQRAALESRLKIPLLYAFDVIHGYRTLFPIPLAETASFDLQAAELSASIAAEEARSAGLRWTFAPMLDVARDPRWGRVMEGSGEDVFLNMQMAKARIRGFQGDDYSAPTKIVACAKHFVAYGAAEAGRDYNGADVSQRRLHETYLPPFRAAVEAGVGSFMTAFNDLNGVPCTGNKWLLTQKLRDEWQFDGIVVSDYNSVGELVAHGLAANASQAAMYSLNAGCDMDMASQAYGQYGAALNQAGQIKMAAIDTAVKNILRIKFRLGLFEDPFVEEGLEEATLKKPEFLQAAREIAAKSFVLLKNANDTLPIRPAEVRRIAVIGALADDQPNGLDWWAGDAKAEDIITVLNGVRTKVSDSNWDIQVNYEPGCASYCDSTAGFAAAVNATNHADFTIVMVGETKALSGEAGSRADIGLPGYQLDLIQAIHATGRKYVVVVKNGRPLTLNWLADNSPAILVTWHSGTMGGAAVADVLFGDVNPSGKLPMTFPRSVGQIPIHYDTKNTGRPTPPNRPFAVDFNSTGAPQSPEGSDWSERYTSRYMDVPQSPLYPFGFGLSYTTFVYKNLQLSRTSTGGGDPVDLVVSVDLENTGSREGTEVVQLYVRDVAASVTRPLRQLRGFRRVTLMSGEQQQVSFTLGDADLGFLGEDLKSLVVEAGLFEIYVGGSSDATLMANFHVLANSACVHILSASVVAAVLVLQRLLV